MFSFQENNLRASRADSIALSEIACIPPPQSTTTGLSQDKVEVSKKLKPKTAKIKTENQIDKKVQLEKVIPQIAVNAYDSDGKLSRSFSTYN